MTQNQNRNQNRSNNKSSSNRRNQQKNRNAGNMQRQIQKAVQQALSHQNSLTPEQAFKDQLRGTKTISVTKEVTLVVGPVHAIVKQLMGKNLRNRLSILRSGFSVGFEGMPENFETSTVFIAFLKGKYNKDLISTLAMDPALAQKIDEAASGAYGSTKISFAAINGMVWLNGLSVTICQKEDIKLTAKKLDMVRTLRRFTFDRDNCVYGTKGTPLQTHRQIHIGNDGPRMLIADDGVNTAIVPTVYDGSTRHEVMNGVLIEIGSGKTEFATRSATDFNRFLDREIAKVPHKIEKATKPLLDASDLGPNKLLFSLAGDKGYLVYSVQGTDADAKFIQTTDGMEGQGWIGAVQRRTNDGVLVSKSGNDKQRTWDFVPYATMPAPTAKMLGANISASS